MIEVRQSSLSIKNSTIVRNDAAAHNNMGRIFYIDDQSNVSIFNSIFWGNKGYPNYDDIFLGDGILNISHSNIQGSVDNIESWITLFDGGGNIDKDPLFVDPDGNDDIIGNEDDNFHLSYGSPCVNSGTLENTDFNDMGAFPSVTVGDLDWFNRTCDFQSIQDGINFISDNNEGGSVLVSPGNYTLSTTLQMKDNISLIGYSPDSTTIDSTFVDLSDYGINSIISNFTIIGDQICVYIGGKSDRNIDTTLKNNIIRNSSFDGVYVDGKSCPFIVNNTIIYNNQIGVRLSNAPGTTCQAIIKNNIIAQNDYGVFNNGSGDYLLDYNDVWDNTIANYSNCQPGTNSISLNPEFKNPNINDYHLLSSSPCIDSGDPLSTFSFEPEPNGGRINMGAYGGTLDAAKTEVCKYDSEPDGDVDGIDLFIFIQSGNTNYSTFANNFGKSDCTY